MHYLTCLTIAGLDPSGGAGVLADVKTFSALGCYAEAVVTALTVQNTLGVVGSQAVDASLLQQQLKALADDVPPVAVKIGMLPNEAVVDVVADFLTNVPQTFVVFDPVMVSTSGRVLMSPSAILRVQERLFPCCSLITPNIPEAECLLDEKVEDSQRAAAQLFGKYGVPVLLKGGHAEGSVAVDILHFLAGSFSFSSPRLSTRNTHGTGCTLSSAIAAYMARGCTLERAVEAGKHYLFQALKAGADVNIGGGHGAANHFFNPERLQIADY